MNAPRVRFLLTFSMVDWVFGMPLQGVQEVQRMVELVPLPLTPGGPKGVINLRGETVPVWELRTLLGFESTPANPEQNIIITQIHAQAQAAPVGSLRVNVPLRTPVPGVTPVPLQPLPAPSTGVASRQGWIVDQVHEVIDTTQGQPAPLDGIPVASYLSGVIRMGAGLVLVLDVERVLARVDQGLRAGSKGS